MVVKGEAGLLDCLEDYASSREANLIVMGSQAMTTQTTLVGSSVTAAAVGSVAFSCLKRLRLPMAIVTANTRLGGGAAGGGGTPSGSMGGAVSGGGSSDPFSSLPSSAWPSSSKLQHSQSQGHQPQLRCMAVVEGHARPMIQYLCGSCLDPLRGDRLLLGQVFTSRMLTTQQERAAKGLMEAFADVASGEGRCWKTSLCLACLLGFPSP